MLLKEMAPLEAEEEDEEEAKTSGTSHSRSLSARKRMFETKKKQGRKKRALASMWGRRIKKAVFVWRARMPTTIYESLDVFGRMGGR